MNEPHRKKLCCMGETSAESSLKTKEETLNSDELQDVQMVAKEHLMEVAKWWNLPTRCRLRRVSSQWSEIISLPEVNERVFVNRSCLTVTQIARRPIPRAIPLPCFHPRAQQPPEGQFARKMANQPPRRIMLASRHRQSQLPSNCRLTDYLRGGLMGPHVRRLIYEEEEPAGDEDDETDGSKMMRCACGCGGPLPKHDYCFILRAIGIYCPNVEKVVLHGACLSFESWGVPGIALKSHWINQPPFPTTGFPRLTSVTLISSSLDCYESLEPLNIGALCLDVEIPYLVLEWRPEESSATMDLSGFIWSDVTAHREWVAKHAKSLPAACQQFISGIDMKNLNWMMKGEPLNADIKYDVHTMDYTTAPLAIILLLAAFIQLQLPAALADQPTSQPSDVDIYWS